MSTAAIQSTKTAGAIIAPKAPRKTHTQDPNREKFALCGKPLTYKSSGAKPTTVTLILANDGETPTCVECGFTYVVGVRNLDKIRQKPSLEIMRHINTEWRGVCTKLADLAPWIQVVFERLEAGEKVGTYTSRTEFCKQVLNRTYGAVKFMLDGGNPRNKNKRLTSGTTQKQLGDGTNTTAAPVAEVLPPADEDDKPAQTTAADPKADEIALGLLKGEEQGELKVKAVDYLTERGIKIHEPVDEDWADDEEEEEGNRRKPTYLITLCVEASQLKTVEKKAKEAFGDAIKSVEKVGRGFSRAAELAEAEEVVTEAREIVGGLKEQMEEWQSNIEEHFSNTEKYQQVEECVSSLEELENDLENISFENVEFPSMF
jgi:hypothetical protein